MTTNKTNPVRSDDLARFYSIPTSSINKEHLHLTHRKPLKLPRPCFSMACQCVKLRRANPLPTHMLHVGAWRFVRFTRRYGAAWAFFARNCNHASPARLNTETSFLVGVLHRFAEAGRDHSSDGRGRGMIVLRDWYIPFLHSVNCNSFDSPCPTTSFYFFHADLALGISRN